MAPLASGSKSEVIIQRITDSLISGDLKPGDKIPTEQEFCDQLKVGRNTVREAIKVLIAFGVLEIRRSEGTFVVDHFSPKLMDSVLYGLILCPRSMDNLLEFKISLWTSMILLAIDKATDEDIAQLQMLYAPWSRLSAHLSPTWTQFSLIPRIFTVFWVRSPTIRSCPNSMS